MRTSDRGFTPDAHPCRGLRCEYDDCPSKLRNPPLAVARSGHLGLLVAGVLLAVAGFGLMSGWMFGDIGWLVCWAGLAMVFTAVAGLAAGRR